VSGAHPAQSSFELSTELLARVRRSNTLASVAEENPRPYKQVARARGQERTRTALQEAALDEFYEGRWQQVSLQEIATKAGVTKQTLLRHFGSKDGLLLQALGQEAKQVMGQRLNVPQGDIDGAVANVLDHYEAWGERSLRVGAWLQSGPPLLAGLSQAAREFHYGWIEYAFAPWLKPLRGKARARRRAALIALCDVQTWWLLSHDLSLPRPEVHAILIDLVERLLGEKPE
jgi:AcrR family transcriptional regulator